PAIAGPDRAVAVPAGHSPARSAPRGGPRCQSHAGARGLAAVTPRGLGGGARRTRRGGAALDARGAGGDLPAAGTRGVVGRRTGRSPGRPPGPAETARPRRQDDRALGERE